MKMNMSEIDNWKVVQKKQIVDDQIGGDLRRQGSKQYHTTMCTIPYKVDKQVGIQSNIGKKQYIAAYTVVYSTKQSIERCFPFHQMFEHP